MTLLLALAGVALATPSDNMYSTLTSAFVDEAKAEAFYQAVIFKFGPVRPFSNIVQAEKAHRQLVAGLMKTRGYAVPSNPYARWPKEPKAKFIARHAVPPTLKEAAQKARELEAQQGPFYDMMMPGAPADVKKVFGRLKADSLQRHEPAFARFLARFG